MKGFTLVEALVAIAIISLAVTGPLFSASRSIIVAENAKNQLIATNLAREGIEYVRMMRDDEYLSARLVGGATVSSDAWNHFLTNNPLTDPTSIANCISPNFCALDPVAAVTPLTQCVGSCNPLYQTVGNGIYTLNSTISGAVQTPFTRSIQASAVTVADEQILVTVSWNFRGTPYFVNLRDHLTPWQ